MSLNRVQLIGNLTRDPEARQIPGGSMVVTLSLATNLTWTDQSGQKQTKTEYHNVVVWRKLAEICNQYLKKGGKVFIEGRLQTRSWDGEDGVKRYRTEIVADNMIMLDGRGGGAAPMMEREAGGIEQSKNEDFGPEPVPAGGADEVSIDDLPF